MLTGVFKDRGARQRCAEEQALAELFASRELRRFKLARRCEIGPFVVDHLFPDQALVVELACPSPPGDAACARRDARVKFLNAMGYSVLVLDPQELTHRPRRALTRLRLALDRHGQELT